MFLAALVLRCAILIGGSWSGGIIDSYDRIAINLVEGRGFSYNDVDPTVARGPVYPYYLSLLLRLFPETVEHGFTAVRIIESVLDSITAVCVALACASWFSRLAGSVHVWAGLAFALNPFMAYYTVKLGPETLSAFLVALYLIALVPAFLVEGNSWLYVVPAGVIAGVLVLSKSVFLPFVVLVPLALSLLYPELRRARFWTRAVTSLAISFAIVAPWVIRNSVLAGSLVLTQTLTGYNFWYDMLQDQNRNHAVSAGDPDTPYRGGSVRLGDGTQYLPYDLNARAEASYDRERVLAAIAWCKRAPDKFGVKVLDNLAAFWFQVETPRKMFVAGTFSVILVGIALGGAARGRVMDHGREAAFFILLVVLLDVIYSPVLGVFRYSLITYPMLSVLCGICLHWMMGCLCPALQRDRSCRGAEHTPTQL